MIATRLFSAFSLNSCRLLSSIPSYQLETDNKIESIKDGFTQKERKMLLTPDYFKVSDLFTVKDLFDARVHYGHKITSLNDHMKPYIFGHRLGYVIFDLDKTAHLLRQALNFIAHMAYRDGIILFISQNPQLTLNVENTAKECKEFAITRGWKFGTFLNSEMKFGIKIRLPELCIFLNATLHNSLTHDAVIEAAKICIPTVGIVDSNSDPRLITYPIPGNDDSYESHMLYLKLFKEAILLGKNARIRDLKAALKSEKKKSENANS